MKYLLQFETLTPQNRILRIIQMSKIRAVIFISGGEGVFTIMIARSYLCVGHPAARFDLVGVEPPVLQFLLEQGAAHVGGVVEFASSEIERQVKYHFINTLI